MGTVYFWPIVQFDNTISPRLCESEHIRRHRDVVTGPGGDRGAYHWLDAALILLVN